MKAFGNTYLKSFFVTTLTFLVVAAAVWRRLNIQYGYVAVLCGALLAAFFVTAGIRLFRRTKGNGIVNALLGYVLILPAVVVMRIVFSLPVFRFGFVVYAVAGLAAIGYAIGVFVVSTKAKRDAEALNRMLKKPAAPPASE